MLWNSLLMLLAVIGHLGICVIVYNQVHATGWPRSIRKGSEKVIAPFSILFPVLILFLLFRGEHPSSKAFDFFQNNPFSFGYAIVCWAVAAFVIAVFARRKFKQWRVKCVVAHSRELIDVASLVEQPLAISRSTKLLKHVPFNGIFKLMIEEKRLRLPDLPGSLRGLSITHLSDFHFTGGTDRAFFEEAIARANALQSDLIVITGDIIDKRNCLDWIDEILGQLTAPLGVYFVLGNHDRRVKPVEETLRRLKSSGMTYVSGRWVTIEKDGTPIHFCGNDLPWFPNASDLPANPESNPDQGIRILLTHSPDQIFWARDFQIDLVFAGHTHGGQIRIPYYGSIVAASKYGNAFSAGVFEEAGTILHVSRGISGTQSLRLNCPPEITKIVLE